MLGSLTNKIYIWRIIIIALCVTLAALFGVTFIVYILFSPGCQVFE